MESSRPWCERTADKLKDSRDMMIISSSDLKSVLLEGTLKFSETCRFPVRGFEAEEFMHGMYNAVTQKTDFLYIFPACGYARERMKKLFGYYQKQGVCPYAINFPDCGDGRKRVLKEKSIYCHAIFLTILIFPSWNTSCRSRCSLC